MDVYTVIDLLQDVSAYRPDPAEVTKLGQSFASQGDSYACVAVHGERLVGFGSLFVMNRVRGGRSAIIEDMVVLTDMRGQGVGRLMLNDLLAQARARGCFKVTLESSEMGKGFYKLARFEEGGRVMKIHL
jgi:glucosamine-phosphate N-acetyltransferase